VGGVAVEDLLSPKGVIDTLLSIRQEEMPDCRGIKHMGFDPHHVYDHEVQTTTRASPRVEHQTDMDTDSVGSMNSSAESWEDHLDEDSSI
jgi:hypothetical protein